MKNGRKHQENILKSCIFLILFLYSISLIFPILWGFVTSFKMRGDYVKSTLSLPSVWKFDNYATAFEYFYVEVGSKTYYIENLLLNSILYAVGCAFIITFSHYIVAYCCTYFSKFKVTKIYTFVVLIAMSLPVVGSQPSELQMLANLGLYDTMVGMYILKANFLTMYFFVFCALISTIPKSFYEAAYMDGANNFTICFKIIMPLTINTFMTVVLIWFINFWNDFQIPLLYLPSQPTLAYGLYKYSFSYKTEISSVPMKMAGCMILFVPILIIFIVFQKRLLGDLTMGGIKG